MPSDRPPTEAKLNVTLPPPTLEASGAVVSLGRAAHDVGLTLEQQKTNYEHELALREQARQDAATELRRWLAGQVVPKFLWANGLTLVALGLLVVLDEINLALHLISPTDRIIGEKVIIALLGATTVQVGAIAAIIARSLFPNRSG